MKKVITSLLVFAMITSSGILNVALVAHDKNIVKKDITITSEF